MRNVILGLAIAFCMAIGGMSAASAAPAGDRGFGTATASDSMFQKVVSAGYCARLKHACDYKEERGEEGQGNCRRYRIECGRFNYCQALRRACVYKEERGQEGRGNCRRYRSECGDDY
ncbi:MULTISPECIES: hypothetical protein [Rhodomicrobium]|uniref:hypothetical protein n=1 Tax=Rhodomicrobium TaxID=1068 RepID=UPI000F736756|nr:MULTISPECIES: hypothetical protein [Rhodomicrobium]